MSTYIELGHEPEHGPYRARLRSCSRARQIALRRVFAKSSEHIERLTYCALALALVAHATLGAYIDDLIIPSRRRGHDVHVHGWQAWLIACAIYLVAVSLIS